MKTRSPELAAVLSFFIPGLGQVYNGENLKAVLFMLGAMAAVVLCEFVFGFFISPMVWVWAVVDAYYSARLINMECRCSGGGPKSRPSLAPDFATLAGERP